jgi:PAS domain S-box-containing protein
MGITPNADAVQRSGTAEDRLRLVIDTIPVQVTRARPDGSLDFINHRWLEFLGVSVEVVQDWGWTTVTHPEDVDRFVSGWRSAMASGEPFEDEVRVRGADGQYRWLLIRAVPLRDDSGNIVNWYAASVDIEDRKRAEEELRRREAYLTEAQRLSHTGSFGWKPESGEIVWSDETYRIFEYSYVVEPTIDLVAQRVHPEERADFLRVIDRASGGATHFEHTYRLLLPDGRVKHVHALAHVVQDASGSREFVGAVTDITEQRRAEESLRDSESYLAEAQKLSHTGSWAWNPNPDKDIRYWSEECYRVLGFDPAGPVPRFEEFFQKIHPDDQAASRERFEKAIRDKADFELDYRIVHPDKGVRDIHVVGRAVLDRPGDLHEFVGTVIDITERKRAEEELRASEQKYRHLVDTTPAFVHTALPNGMSTSTTAAGWNMSASL